VVAAAIVDRLLHDATVVNIRCRSYQMRAQPEESKMEKMVPG
jgi:DNA replication protein DnaC